MSLASGDLLKQGPDPRLDLLHHPSGLPPLSLSSLPSNQNPEKSEPAAGTESSGMQEAVVRLGGGSRKRRDQETQMGIRRARLPSLPLRCHSPFSFHGSLLPRTPLPPQQTPLHSPRLGAWLLLPRSLPCPVLSGVWSQRQQTRRALSGDGSD